MKRSSDWCNSLSIVRSSWKLVLSFSGIPLARSFRRTSWGKVLNWSTQPPRRFSLVSFSCNALQVLPRLVLNINVSFYSSTLVYHFSLEMFNICSLVAHTLFTRTGRWIIVSGQKWTAPLELLFTRVERLSKEHLHVATAPVRRTSVDRPFRRRFREGLIDRPLRVACWARCALSARVWIGCRRWWLRIVLWTVVFSENLNLCEFLVHLQRGVQVGFLFDNFEEKIIKL